MIRVNSRIASELYDIINHCRNDKFEDFYNDLLDQLADEADKELQHNNHNEPGSLEYQIILLYETLNYCKCAFEELGISEKHKGWAAYTAKEHVECSIDDVEELMRKGIIINE